MKRIQHAYATNVNIPAVTDTATNRSISSSNDTSEHRRRSEEKKEAPLSGGGAAMATKGGPRFSSSTVNERAGSRIVARDAKSNVSKIIFVS